ncbi:MAG: GNAT family N-acetyltransferase [Pseudomonadota bacterium]
MTTGSDTKNVTGLAALRLSMRQHARLQAAAERSFAGSKYKATGSRLLSELLAFPRQTHSDLGKALGWPTSQVSRVAKPLEIDGLIKSEPAKKRNQKLLSLTESGVLVAKEIDELIDLAVNDEFKRLDEVEHTNLFLNWDVSTADADWLDTKSTVKLRPFELDDLSWLLNEMEDAAWQRPYKEQLPLDILDLVASYMKQPWYERHPLLGVAHNGPTRLGVCLMRHDGDDVRARIELLYVKPSVRRMGIATMLVQQAISAATEMTYTRVSVQADEKWSGLDLFLRGQGFTRSRETKPVTVHNFQEQHRYYSFEIGRMT